MATSSISSRAAKWHQRSWRELRCRSKGIVRALAARPRCRHQGDFRDETTAIPIACDASSRSRAVAALSHPNVVAIFDIGASSLSIASTTAHARRCNDRRSWVIHPDEHAVCRLQRLEDTTWPGTGKAASKRVRSAMRRRKKGTLKSGSGGKVKSRKQAIAIGLSEAREKGAKVPRRKTSRKRASKKR